MAQPEVVRDDEVSRPSGSPHAPRDLRLITRFGAQSWLGRIGADGTSRTVVAYRLAGEDDPTVADSERLPELAASLAACGSPGVVPLLGAVQRDGAIWLVSEWDDGVPLSRLRRLTALRTATAAAIGIGIVGALRALHEAGGAHGDLAVRHVLIGMDGRVRLAGWGRPVLRGDYTAARVREDDLTAAAALLTQLCLPDTDPVPADLDQLDAALRRTLRRADARGTAMGRATRELAELARAAAGRPAPRAPTPMAGPVTQRVAARNATPGAVQSKAAQSKHGKRILRAVLRRSWPSLVALVVLATAVVLEFGFLHGPLSKDVHQLLGTNPVTHPARPTGPTAEPAPPPPSIAPASAGAVTSVQLRALRPCTVNTACPVSVTVQVLPQRTALTLAWRFQVVDRCAGRQRELPGESVTVPVGDTSMTVVGTVTLPPGGPLAVVAVTTAPAQVASSPVLAPDPAFC
ncbi:MAG TPA: protein kinase [Pseudonocardiaceae bacterium]|nr:protein kinase [Pseudonocardiaceae bacterium]